MSTFKVMYCYENNDDLMEPTIVTFGQLSYLRKNEIYKHGYRFKGWYAYRVSDNTLSYEGKSGKRKFYEEGKQPKGWIPYLYQDECGVGRLSKVDGDVVMMQAQWERCLLDSPEYASENKEILREKLLHSPIVLFGGADECKYFYQRYHEIVNIRCILTDNLEEKEITLENGTTVKLKPYSKSKIQLDDYIIVCRTVKNYFDKEYKNAIRVLTNDGFEHAMNYLRMSIAISILENKKIWLWMGYCQFTVLRDIFREIDSINQEYVFDVMRLERDVLKGSYKYSECQDLVKICDVLVYIPFLIANKKMDFDFRKYLPQNATAIRLPGMAFRGYYPYKDANLLTHHKYTYDSKLHWPFNYEEKFLDELILKGLNDDEIYEEVMREDFIDKAVIQKNLKHAIKFIQILESKTDIKISDYIQENLTKRMLYRDGLHYQNEMYFELARRLSDQLNLKVVDDINHIEYEAKEKGIEFIDYTEVPVLPCVAKALGLDFITDDTLWRVRFTEKGKNFGTNELGRGIETYEIRMMTRKEWIYAYVAYTRSQITLKNLWNLKTIDVDS